MLLTIALITLGSGPAVHARAPFSSPAPTPPSIAVGAAPEPVSGNWYLKAYGGLSFLEDEEVLYTDGGGTTTTAEGTFSSGWLTGAALGYRIDDHWSLELDFTYRTNDVESVSGGLATGGDFASGALLVNALYWLHPIGEFEPYLGVGLGVASEIDIDLEGGSFGTEQSFSGSSPMAQYMAGVQFPVSGTLDGFLEGRYARAFDPDMSGEGNSGNVESEYGQVALLAGLSWSF